MALLRLKHRGERRIILIIVAMMAGFCYGSANDYGAATAGIGFACGAVVAIPILIIRWIKKRGLMTKRLALARGN
jgi:hypothetical protein